MLQWALGTGKVNSVALVSLDEKWAERQYVLITNKTTQSCRAPFDRSFEVLRSHLIGEDSITARL